MKSKGGFVAELQRRNVIRGAGLYLVGAWLVTQVAGTVLPMFGAPGWLPRSIVLLLAIGFIPALVFAWVFELTPSGFKRDAEVLREQSIGSQTGRRMEHMIVVVLALALGYFGFDKFVLAPRREAAIARQAAQSERSAALTAALAKSIAVLPLANAGGQDQQFFSDGLSENLIIALSQFDGLQVIGRNSAFQFRDSKDDAPTIGRKLGVAHLLEGSVQHAGDAVRISVELLNAATGRTLWSQQYDRPYKDLFALQDDITKAIAGALKAKLLASDNAAAQSDRPPSGKLDAYTAYLQGKAYVARNTEADDRKAIDTYTSATRLDPQYALAWAELSQAWASFAGEFIDDPAEQQQARAQALAAATTALALNPNLAEAHKARGTLLLKSDSDWTDAEAEFRRALQLEPNDGDAMKKLGSLMAALGQAEQAVALTRQALATDPLNARWYAWLSIYFSGLDRLDEAEQAIRKAIELQPLASFHHAQLAIVEIRRGDAKAALAAAQQEPAGTWQDSALALAQQVSGDPTAADAALKSLIDKHPTESPYQIAEVYALRRDADNTFAWLDRAWEARDAGISGLLTDPFLLRYQHDPRFAAFCRKVGLPTTTDAKAMP